MVDESKVISTHGLDSFGVSVDFKLRLFFGEVCASSFTDSNLIGYITRSMAEVWSPGSVYVQVQYNGNNNWRMSERTAAR